MQGAPGHCRRRHAHWHARGSCPCLLPAAIYFSMIASLVVFQCKAAHRILDAPGVSTLGLAERRKYISGKMIIKERKN